MNILFRRRGLLFFLLLLLNSCTPVAPIPTFPIAQPTPSPTIVHPLPIPTATASPVPAAHIVEYQCPKIAPDLPADTHPKGILIGDSFLLNFETGKKSTLKNSPGGYIPSPNGKWLISTSVDNNDEIWLVLQTLDSKEQNRIAWNKDWFLLAGWLDNEHVWVSHLQEPMITVINPFTGEQQKLASDFPGIKTIIERGRHFTFGDSAVVYNPPLNLAVYRKAVESGAIYTILWDVKTGQALAQIEDVPSSYHNPLWAASGDRVFIAGFRWYEKANQSISDFFILNQNGQVHQLTDFGHDFTDVETANASLSPDERKIAFWLDLSPSPNSGFYIAVFDMDSGKTTDYCIPGPKQGRAPGGSPIWSPDSWYLLVEHQYDENAYRLILLDTLQGSATQILADSPNAFVTNWITGNP